MSEDEYLTPSGYWTIGTRSVVIAEIRRALRARSGRSWRVFGGTGTAWLHIEITVPRARLVNGRATEEDARLLGELMRWYGPRPADSILILGADWIRAVRAARGDDA